MCNKPISWNFTRNIIVRFMLASLHFNALSFYRSQNFLSQPKNLTAFNASSKSFVPAINQFYWMQSFFCLVENICVWHIMYLLVRHKIFWELYKDEALNSGVHLLFNLLFWNHCQFIYFKLNFFYITFGSLDCLSAFL